MASLSQMRVAHGGTAYYLSTFRVRALDPTVHRVQAYPRGAGKRARAGWSPKLVPYGADQTIYLVVDSFSASGTVYRETEVERTDFETIIADFLTGQFNDPVRVIAFNTLEHWSDDVSEAIATEIQTRCDIEGVSVPEHVGDFVDRYKGPVRQLTLKLA